MHALGPVVSQPEHVAEDAVHDIDMFPEPAPRPGSARTPVYAGSIVAIDSPPLRRD